tara:strand:+ start:695 stop:991 length:297 start_codon:yes stop_codon:yes gene_type:complete
MTFIVSKRLAIEAACVKHGIRGPIFDGTSLDIQTKYECLKNRFFDAQQREFDTNNEDLNAQVNTFVERGRSGVDDGIMKKQHRGTREPYASTTPGLQL